MSHVSLSRTLTKRELEIRSDWVANCKAVRQRTVRQETTKFKAGTFPLNMYATSSRPTEKIILGKKLWIVLPTIQKVPSRHLPLTTRTSITH